MTQLSNVLITDKFVLTVLLSVIKTFDNCVISKVDVWAIILTFNEIYSTIVIVKTMHEFQITVKLGDKEQFDMEQIGVKEPFGTKMPVYIIRIRNIWH